ncbi:MAG TPA: cupin domain-containing protein [Trueperaceae bacterium]
MMKIATIASARSFSSREIRQNELLRGHDLHVTLLCFEAGQQAEEAQAPFELLYQVLEGEMLFHQGDARQRIGKGKLLLVPANTPHLLENAGGGLLVVMKTGRSA